MTKIALGIAAVVFVFVVAAALPGPKLDGLSVSELRVEGTYREMFREPVKQQLQNLGVKFDPRGDIVVVKTRVEITGAQKLEYVSLDIDFPQGGPSGRGSLGSPTISVLGMDMNRAATEVSHMAAKDLAAKYSELR